MVICAAVFFSLIMMFSLVYALMSYQPSSVFTGPTYIIISLIPSVAFSLISWTLKKLHSGSTNAAGDQPQAPESMTEQRDANDSNTDENEELAPLLTVNENCDSEASNHVDDHNYGATM